MTSPARDLDTPNPTPDQLAEARRNLYRIAEHNATIDIWTARAAHATHMAEYHRDAKERFIESIAGQLNGPFWLPTS